MDRSVDELIARGFSREQAIKIYLENNTHRGHYPPQQTGLSAQHAMVVPPQSYGSSQNSSFPIPENADDQALQLGLLLSQQEAMFGSNMYDSLTAADDPIIENFMSKGYSKEEAILYVFEGKFGKALAQPVATTQPVSFTNPNAVNYLTQRV